MVKLNRSRTVVMVVCVVQTLMRMGETWSSYRHNSLDDVNLRSLDQIEEHSLGKLSEESSGSNCTYLQRVSNCSHRGLNYIPQSLPQATTTLILSFNIITTRALTPAIFTRYVHLSVLLLDNNKIVHLPDAAFQGLRKLTQLDLFHNRLRMNSKLNRTLAFQPLKQLKWLRLSKNVMASNPHYIYPDHALSYLTNLEELHMDGLRNDTHFGKGFQNLKRLKVLSLAGFRSGNCNITALKNDTFVNVAMIRTLNISDCRLNAREIERNALAPLKSLEVLDVSNNFYNFSISALGGLMHGLQDSKTLKRLLLKRITPRYAPCSIVYKDDLKYLVNTSIEFIDARSNEIELVENGALDLLPPSLNIIDARENRIMFGTYWKDLVNVSNVTHIYLEGLRRANTFPSFYPDISIDCGHKAVSSKMSTTTAVPPVVHCTCGQLPPCPPSPSGHLLLPLPPRLVEVSMRGSGMAYRLTEMAFCPNSLQRADLSMNLFKGMEGPIRGLSELQFLNLSYCEIESIGHRFFDEFPKLEHLILAYNELGQAIYKDKKGRIFDHLDNLSYLDLSSNSLFYLQKPCFSSLTNLKVLNVSNNRLHIIEFDIGHMEQLQVLDLHENTVMTLPEKWRDHIGKLISKGIQVRVNMSFNPISCECSNLEFLEWTEKTGVFGNNLANYSCYYPTSDNPYSLPLPSDGFHSVIRNLRGECTSHKSIFLAVLGCCVLIVTTVIAALVHRFRWTLKYWYHASKLWVTNRRSDEISTGKEFQYDVFVSYANEDEDFVVQHIQGELKNKYGLRLCLHGENFGAGRYITDNIFYAVTHSRKTLVVITRGMLKSHWCIYELQMAQQESISTGRNVLVFMFKEEVSTRELSADILQYIRTNTYVAYPHSERHRALFWKNLARDLKGK